MDSGQLAKAFTATVQASLHGLRSLEPLLRQEQTALTGKDPALLTRLVEQKLGLLKQLEPSVHARDRLQRAAGLPAGLDGGTRLVGTLGEETLSADWAEMTRLAQAVAELNDRNSQLAMQGQRTTRSALGILTGRALHDETYGPLRRRRPGTSSHTLGRV
jgi:flagellar biosynthesis/type III secretory pathway chaperone